MHSIYEFVNLGWDDTYFLDITCRTDWSSTLHPTKWSYTYPSVSASVLLDKALKINTPYVNMLKVRASWANVGNDTSPYSLYDAYSKTSLPGGFTLPSTLKDAYINPENVESWEVGFEGKFLNNRLNFDIALYKNTTTDQILGVSQSAETGATKVMMNAGRVENKGIEISFRLRPVQTRDLLWEINGNWARNKNKLCELNDGWDPSTPLQTSMGVTIGSRTLRLLVHRRGDALDLRPRLCSRSARLHLHRRKRHGDRLFGDAAHRSADGLSLADRRSQPADCQGESRLEGGFRNLGALQEPLVLSTVHGPDGR